MLVAAACLVVLALTAWIRSGADRQPLDRDDVHRLRRFSERLHREESLPFE
jgi:hypothetical protein